MATVFSIFRWATFALFFLSNIIVCSIAGWNLSLVSASSQAGMLDAFLIFLGAFGIVLILPIIVIEFLRRNALSGRVWFELAWVALFWVLYFAGAVSVTAIMPNGLCDAAVVAVSNLACNSSRALLALTWIPTAFLMIYFFALAVLAVIHSKDDDKIWHASVGSYSWNETKQSIRSAPNTPVMSRFSSKKPPSFVVPKPHRPPPIFVQHRAGLSSNYEIEHFPDPSSIEEQPLPPPPPQRPAVNAMALYPQEVQSSLAMREVKNTQPLNVYRKDAGASGATEPPPVRDWPRQIGDERPRRHRERAATTTAAVSSSFGSAPAVSRNEQTPATQQLRPLMLGRSSSNGDASSRRSDKGKGRMTEEQIRNEQQRMLERANTKASGTQGPPAAPLPPVPQIQNAGQQRHRPTGPRSRSTSGEKHRPPPLNLSYNKHTARR